MDVRIVLTLRTALITVDKGKKEKDKDAPKKPISAFFCYQKTRREALKKEQPALDNKQVVSVR